MRRVTARETPCSSPAVPRHRALQEGGPIMVMAQGARLARASPAGMTAAGRVEADTEIRPRARAPIRICSCTATTAAAEPVQNSRAGTKPCVRGFQGCAWDSLTSFLLLRLFSTPSFPFPDQARSSSGSFQTPSSDYSISSSAAPYKPGVPAPGSRF